MAKGKQAKTASKNNPSSRKAARVYTYNGAAVKPTLFVGDGGSYMSAEFADSGKIVMISGNPIHWNEVVNSAENS